MKFSVPIAAHTSACRVGHWLAQCTIKDFTYLLTYFLRLAAARTAHVVSKEKYNSITINTRWSDGPNVRAYFKIESPNFLLCSRHSMKSRVESNRDSRFAHHWYRYRGRCPLGGRGSCNAHRWQQYVSTAYIRRRALFIHSFIHSFIGSFIIKEMQHTRVLGPPSLTFKRSPQATVFMIAVISCTFLFDYFSVFCSITFRAHTYNTPCLRKKNCASVIFLNNSVQHWPILIIFGTQRREEKWRKWLSFCPSHLNTVATQPCEIVVLPLTTMNSYWVVHASVQKIIENRYLFIVDRIHFEIVLPDVHTVCGCPLLGTFSAVPYSSVFESK